jgi:hypothetical protein
MFGTKPFFGLSDATYKEVVELAGKALQAKSLGKEVEGLADSEKELLNKVSAEGYNPGSVGKCYHDNFTKN